MPSDDLMDDLLRYANSPAGQRNGQLLASKAKLECRLGWRDQDGYVVATDEGRTVVSVGGELRLDIGDDPTILTLEEATALAASWNNMPESINRVAKLVDAREFISAQIARLEERLKASEY